MTGGSGNATSVLTDHSWAIGERQADGRLRPLLVCDDDQLALELSEDLLRLGRNVEAVEIEEKASVALN